MSVHRLSKTINIDPTENKSDLLNKERFYLETLNTI